MKPKELQQRLSNAYDAGYFDGYHKGSDVAHTAWLDELIHIKGVGLKLENAIVLHMAGYMERRHKDNSMEKNELSKELDKLEDEERTT
jgi:hypothetical protein